ncbi:S66 peptidase family protein [Lacrimispora sp.]|uniref:S66 family peptidase n=1 Tax=Lacrimispora sp. TaxID=2719234 RepID=UPI00345F5C90
MKYARLLQKGDIIGVCAPSSGVPEGLFARIDNAVKNVQALGYDIIETNSVRRNTKCVSNNPKIRADEFMSLYENPKVAAIIPPWGGEFLMDMLQFLDLKRLSELTPKWICGYSDISTLAFVLSTNCDIATVHGSNFMNMGYAGIHKSDVEAFHVMSELETEQHNSEYYGVFSGWDISKEIYNLDKSTQWKSLGGETKLYFEGRMIGGCLDTVCKLIGTRFAPVHTFLERYKKDGFIWTLESCEMNAGEIYCTLWQMRECGWFEYCNGFLLGRADGYSDTQDFCLIDAYRNSLADLGVPVIYDTDIGHIPPQIQIVNGAIGKIEFNNGDSIVTQMLGV